MNPLMQKMMPNGVPNAGGPGNQMLAQALMAMYRGQSPMPILEQALGNNPAAAGFLQTVRAKGLRQATMEECQRRGIPFDQATAQAQQFANQAASQAGQNQ